ncbi:hypothetical protein [Croceimicrobium sp.]|uniref:hypothetical protein n=1 Tax=Croceimicrobium sp. TaxID=2828340 RepID=UPI003BA84B9B
MRLLLLLSCVLFSSLSLKGQSQPNDSILPVSLRQLTLDDKSWITSNGFPLTEYDYSNDNINMELSFALKERNQGEVMSTISYIAIGAGGALLLAPLVIESLSGTRTISTIFMLGGITLNLAGMYNRLGAKKRVENASYLFQESR